ncbi:MAG TPA: glycosyltransferase, partial [Gemmatales bacterium]|nr:glycosyltransferase [Gemmatales bacterium]
PPQTKLLEFPFYDGNEVQELSAEVKHFLKQGEPPVIMTFGSAMKHGQGLYRTVISACQELNLRALILTPFRDQLPATLPESALHQNYIPLSQVLPYASCLVHHGGIGTTAQALRAGIPQLITPLAHDQFDNAERVMRLDAGLALPASRLTPKNAATLLSKLLMKEKFQQAAKHLSNRMQNENSFAECCTILEQFASRRSSTRFHI